MLVYHYCSMEAFKSIIENKTLRLSDIRKSNDSDEVILITKYINDILLEEYDKSPNIHIRYPESLLREMINHFNLNWFSEDFSVYCLYVISFSSEGDLLSQWRGYADDATGVSIGFDSETLEQLNHTGWLRFKLVSYDIDRQQEFVRNRCRDLIANLSKEASTSDIKDAIMDPFNELYKYVYIVSPFFKSPFFAEEKECRIVLWDGKEKLSAGGKDFGGYSLSKLKYVNANGILRSYTNLLFKNCQDSLVREVNLGPRCKSTVSDVKGFLKLNGLESVIVNQSEGTYR